MLVTQSVKKKRSAKILLPYDRILAQTFVDSPIKGQPSLLRNPTKGNRHCSFSWALIHRAVPNSLGFFSNLQVALAKYLRYERLKEVQTYLPPCNDVFKGRRSCKAYLTFHGAEFLPLFKPLRLADSTDPASLPAGALQDLDPRGAPVRLEPLDSRKVEDVFCRGRHQQPARVLCSPGGSLQQAHKAHLCRSHLERGHKEEKFCVSGHLTLLRFGTMGFRSVGGRSGSRVDEDFRDRKGGLSCKESEEFVD
jgi:hypothetical protein